MLQKKFINRGRWIFSLFLSIVLLAIPAGRPAHGSGTIPTIAILSVENDQSVTLQCYNFPAGDTFQVLMGAYGTLGVNGYPAGQIDTGAGGNFKVTFVIPAQMKGAERIAIRLQSPTSGYYAYNWFYNKKPSPPAVSPLPTQPGFQPLPAGVIPTISITDVKADKSVTIRTANYPAHDTFDVLMGAYGTYGVGGIKVGTLDSGSGGVLEATFDIPATLKGAQRIAIRLQSPSSGYYSFNWFYNTTASTSIQPLPAGVIPTISIASVKADKSVTIRTANYPAHDTFDVLMGAYGTYGVGGIKVGTLDSGSGGVLEATFDIPAALKGAQRIAIRLQSPSSGYYSFNWFYNTTTP